MPPMRYGHSHDGCLLFSMPMLLCRHMPPLLLRHASDAWRGYAMPCCLREFHIAIPLRHEDIDATPLRQIITPARHYWFVAAKDYA